MAEFVSATELSMSPTSSVESVTSIIMSHLQNGTIAELAAFVERTIEQDYDILPILSQAMNKCNYTYYLEFTLFLTSPEFVRWSQENLCTIITDSGVTLCKWLQQKLATSVHLLPRVSATNTSKTNGEGERNEPLKNTTSFLMSSELKQTLSMIRTFCQSDSRHVSNTNKELDVQKIIKLYKEYINQFVPVLVLVTNYAYTKIIFDEIASKHSHLQNELILNDCKTYLTNLLQEIPWTCMSLSFYRPRIDSILHSLLRLPQSRDIVDVYLDKFSHLAASAHLLQSELTPLKELQSHKDLVCDAISQNHVRIIEILSSTNLSDIAYFERVRQTGHIDLLVHLGSIPGLLYDQFGAVVFDLLVRGSGKVTLFFCEKNHQFVTVFLQEIFLSKLLDYVDQHTESVLTVENIVKSVLCYETFVVDAIKRSYLDALITHKSVSKNTGVSDRDRVLAVGVRSIRLGQPDGGDRTTPGHQVIINLLEPDNGQYGLILAMKYSQYEIFSKLLQVRTQTNYDQLILAILVNESDVDRTEFVKLTLAHLTKGPSDSNTVRYVTILRNLVDHQYFCTTCIICRCVRTWHWLLYLIGWRSRYNAHIGKDAQKGPDAT